jgi:glycosyltransferase involved in cell wall biosynthesis
LISIVISAKNNGDVLGKCLSTIEELDYPKEKIETIIVDGYSDDETVEIANRYGGKVIFENIGIISYARDLGVKPARGEFIAFTDTDCDTDKISPNNIENSFILASLAFFRAYKIILYFLQKRMVKWTY